MFVVRKANNDAPTPPLNPDEENVSKIVRQGIGDLENAAVSREVKDAIASRNYEAIVNAFPWDDTTKTLNLTADAFGKTIANNIGTGIKAGFKARFDYTDPRSIAWGTEQSARLVTAVTDEVRNQIRDVIGQAFTQNKTVVETARQLRTFIGLNQRQQNSLEKFIQANIDAPNLDKLIIDYKKRAIKYRADMIARTEIITAESNGRYLGWTQAVEAGLADPNGMKRWSAASGERTCDTCGAMNGKSVKWDEPFPNGVFNPPAHVMCRCSTSFLDPESELAQDFMLPSPAIVAPPRENIPEKITQAIKGLRDSTAAVEAAHSGTTRVSSFQYDSTAVENLNVDVEKVDFNGVPSTELRFKMTSPALTDFEKQAKRAKNKDWLVNKEIAAIDVKTADGKLTFSTLDPDASQTWSILERRTVGDLAWDQLASTNATYTRYLPDGTAIRIISSAKNGYAFHGTTRVIIPGKPTAEKIDEIMSKLVPSARHSTQEDVDLLKANRILSIFKPADKELAAKEFAEKKKYIDDVIGKYWGFKWDDVTTELDSEGRLRFLLPRSVAEKIMDKTSIGHINHSLKYGVVGSTDGSTVKNIVELFTKDENKMLLSTTNRWTRGLNYEGQSSVKDITTGGGDYVFARPVDQVRAGSYQNLYRLEFDAAELFRRTDWFAYAADSYGVRNPAAKTFFKGSTKFDEPNWFGELMTGGSRAGAEIMFQSSIDMRYVTSFPIQERIQKPLFEAFIKLGITEINGIPLDDFFRTI